MYKYSPTALKRAVCALTASTFAAVAPTAFAAWEPSKPAAFVVPAGTGGGDDQMEDYGGAPVAAVEKPRAAPAPVA